LTAWSPEPLDHIFPGSWINANFDVWIGAEEDNRPGRSFCARARRSIRRRRSRGASAAGVRRVAHRRGQRLVLVVRAGARIGNRPEFDQLYRSHLANVYRFLNLMPPEELSRPILRIAAGVYHVDERSGSMHGKKFLVKEVFFGSDGQDFYLRIDLNPGYEQTLGRMEARFTGQTQDGARSSQVTIGFDHGVAKPVDLKLAVAANGAVECAYSRVLEARISLAAMGIAGSQGLRFQFSLWEGGLPVDAVPQQGWLEMKSVAPAQFGE
jgi:hypothetical protein